MDLSCGGTNISVVVVASALLILHQAFNLGMNSRESNLRDGKNAIINPPLAETVLLLMAREKRANDHSYHTVTALYVLQRSHVLEVEDLVRSKLSQRWKMPAGVKIPHFEFNQIGDRQCNLLTIIQMGKLTLLYP